MNSGSFSGVCAVASTSSVTSKVLVSNCRVLTLTLSVSWGCFCSIRLCGARGFSKLRSLMYWPCRVRGPACGWAHSVGDKYIQAVIRAIGALPVMIPAMGPELGDNAVTEALDRLLDMLDGVLLTGSPSNVEPHHYEGEASRPGTAHDPARDATTLPLIRHTIDRGVPLIAICRGLQEVHVALGGTLHQLVHEVGGRRDQRS